MAYIKPIEMSERLSVRVDSLPPLMTRREVAAFFAVGEATVKRWDDKGILENVSPVRDARYRSEDVLEIYSGKYEV